MDKKQYLIDVWHRIDDDKDLTAVDELFGEDFVRHGRRELDREGFRAVLAELHRGFPDLRSHTLDVIEEDDRVAYRWESTGTHLGLYMGALPTGRTITARGITISRFADGRIVEDWASWNELTVLHDLGILPIDRA